MTIDQRDFAATSRAIWAIVATMLIATLAGFHLANLSLDFASLRSEIAVAAACVAIAWFYRRRRPDPWISIGAECAAQLALIMSLGVLLTYPLAATGLPYRDAELHAIDTWLGLDWRAYLAFYNAHPAIGAITGLAYSSMRPQFIAVLLVLVMTSRFMRLQQYILATAIALIITLVIFPFVPAIASYAYLQIAPADYANFTPSVPFEHIRHLEAMRTGSWPVISAHDLEGLITFPSFHTVCGLLFTWALFPVRYLRWCAVALNMLLIASTPIEGAHYFIDVIAGAAVTAISLYGATRLTAMLQFAAPPVAAPRIANETANASR
jgi:membrane-associated phospholipid phosphatase